MKKQILAAIATLTMIISFTATGFADWNHEISASVPFSFMVNGKTLPAGDYLITTNNSETVLIIKNRVTHDSVGTTAPKMIGKVGTPLQLVFRRYGQQAFLAEVYNGAQHGLMIAPSREERDARIVARQSTPEVITLAARTNR